MQQDWDPFAGFNLVTIWGDYYVAVRSSYGRDVAGALPSCEFDFCVFEFSGQDCGEESFQAGFSFYFGLQAGLQKYQLARSHTC